MVKGGRAVGIDFGTSTSLVAEGSIGRQTFVVPIGRTTSSMPSWVALKGDGFIVGEDAQNQTLDIVAKSVKTAITRNRDSIRLEGDLSRQINADAAIIAVLREVGRRAKSRDVDLSEDSIRLGCPAMWDGTQRRRLLSLAKRAGLPVSDHTLIDEPIAAGVAWVTDRINKFREHVNGKVLVFDMGGGTLDIALLHVELSPSGQPEISVLACVGVDHAGDQLDQAIARDLWQMLIQGGFPKGDPAGGILEALVLQESRRVKEFLSQLQDVEVVVRHPGVPLLTYSREQLENAFEPQLAEAEELVWAAIRASRLTNEEGGNAPIDARSLMPSELAREVKYVLLAGGMSQIPAVETRLGKILPHSLVFDNAGTTADEAVVAGLADPISYERINLHRPGFDFYLEVPGKSEFTLYEAHTPLYSYTAAITRSILYYEASVSSRMLPAEGGVAWLRARSS